MFRLFRFRFSCAKEITADTIHRTFYSTDASLRTLPSRLQYLAAELPNEETFGRAVSTEDDQAVFYGLVDQEDGTVYINDECDHVDAIELRRVDLQ